MVVQHVHRRMLQLAVSPVEGEQDSVVSGILGPKHLRPECVAVVKVGKSRMHAEIVHVGCNQVGIRVIMLASWAQKNTSVSIYITLKVT